MRILIVEDEAAIGRAIERILAGAGYGVDLVGTAAEALEWAGTYPYDLIVLDVVLPGMTGLAASARLRSGGSEVPILMLTALDEVADRVAGLDAGADDYLAKPFAAEELLARVRALLRRGAGERPPVLRAGDLEVDPASLAVRRAGRPIRLTAKEFALLEVLVRNPGRVFSQQRLIDAVWSAGFEAESNVVEVYIRSLRRKIDAGRRDGLIETVRGAGYRLRESGAED
ncbi:MAG: response regulator transcription factor [Chloroflexota bacterium]|nr:response regulator transcription factor [Chloroflexota bacterium]